MFMIPRMAPLLCVLTLLAFAGLARAGEGDPGQIVTRQFDAFRVDDLDRAYSYASPMIQRYYGSAGGFGLMVERSYPMVRDPGKVRMLDLREEGGRILQRVEILDSKGTLYLLDYEMIEGDDGWKINGVQFVAAPPLAT